MSDIVFILGAGASRAGGAPLMHDFLDVAERLLRRGASGADHQRRAFDLVFRGIAAMQPVLAKATIDTDNLEDVFAAFEMAKLFGSLPPLSEDEVRRLPDALRAVIVRTLEHELIYQVVTIPAPYVAAPKPYDAFGGLLRTLHSREDTSVSVMTFNYDLALDTCLVGTDIHYCLWARAPERSSALEVLKLHGSLNWRRCQGCRDIVAWDLNDVLRNYVPIEFEKGRTRFEVGQRLAEFVDCPAQATSPAADPMIVPPTWSKLDQYVSIEPVWRRAAWHLAQARNIFIIGYSLPETDQFFRYLYALGTLGSARLERVWVVDPDPEKRVSARFERLLGPLARRRFQHLAMTFGEAMPIIAASLKP